MRRAFIAGSIVVMLCGALVARAETKQSVLEFEPMPPVPATVRPGDTGLFRASVVRNGSRSRLTSGVSSTNPAVLTLQPEGGHWRWRAVRAGDAATKVQFEERTLLSPEVQARSHNVALRAVYVPPEWHGFVHFGGGWPSAVPVKESQNLKYFEAAVWVEKRAVHLYEFDDSFEPYVYDYDGTAEEFATHRESFRVMQIPGLPVAPADNPYSREVSFFLQKAFNEIATYLVGRYPDSEHHLIFNGHGAPGGRLIEYRMHADDVDRMLAHWTAALERPLGVIDMGGPCNKAGYEDLANFCRHARFYVGSDMPNGGYEMDEWTIEKYYEVDPDAQYHRLFTEQPELHGVLVERVNLKRKSYEYARQNMVENQWPQASSLFSCQQWEAFHGDALPFLKDLSQESGISWDGRSDLLAFFVANGADQELIEAYQRLVVHRVDNSDFFDWPESRNGITLPARSWTDLAQ